MTVQILARPKLFTRLRALPNRVGAGVAVKGDAARYALVWEWGSVRLKHPGPKTTWGANPDLGERRVLTLTAPSGYFRINKRRFYAMAQNALSTINVGEEMRRGSLVETLRGNLMKAATEIAQVAAHDAPIDTGALRASIMAVDENETQQLFTAAYRVLVIGDFDE